uniref:Uncharacterized protein n=1 Tax=Solanum lycopersicum TaxID=4081 RepID=A0A3Q7ILK8_SOLLC
MITRENRQIRSVSLEISAEAGRTGADKRIEDKASAAENAFNEEELSSVELKTVWFKEHTMAEVLCFVAIPAPEANAELQVNIDLTYRWKELIYLYNSRRAPRGLGACANQGEAGDHKAQCLEVPGRGGLGTRRLEVPRGRGRGMQRGKDKGSTW